MCMGGIVQPAEAIRCRAVWGGQGVSTASTPVKKKHAHVRDHHNNSLSSRRHTCVGLKLPVMAR